MPDAGTLRAKLVHGRLTDSYYRTQLAEYVCRLLPADGPCTILDVGSGEGLLAALIQQQRPDTDVVCVETFIRRRREVNATAVRIDGLHLPFATASFDVALLINVLHHASDPRALLHEVYRVTRRRVLIKDHLANSWFQYQKLALLDVLGNIGTGAVVRGHYLSDHQWSAMLAKLHETVITRYDKLCFRTGLLGRLFANDLEVILTLDRL
jgi:SAM-dependent methyltransferase